jgi:hypothetical protein
MTQSNVLGIDSWHLCPQYKVMVRSTLAEIGNVTSEYLEGRESPYIDASTT